MVEKIFIADKPTLDLVKDDTNTIKSGINDIQTSLTNAGGGTDYSEYTSQTGTITTDEGDTLVIEVNGEGILHGIHYSNSPSGSGASLYVQIDNGPIRLLTTGGYGKEFFIPYNATFNNLKVTRTSGSHMYVSYGLK